MIMLMLSFWGLRHAPEKNESSVGYSRVYGNLYANIHFTRVTISYERSRERIVLVHIGPSRSEISCLSLDGLYFYS